MRMEYSKS